MAAVLEPRQFSVARAGSVRTMLPVVLDPETSSLTLTIDDPESLPDSEIAVALIVEIDGVEHRLSGSMRGGKTEPHPVHGPRRAYRLSWQLPMGYFGESSTDPAEWVNIKPRRLGETAKSTFRARAEIVGKRGAIAPTIRIDADIEPAPRFWEYHHSIAYDTQTSVEEEGGSDYAISTSFTASAGSNRVAIVVASTNRDTVQTTHTVTFGGAGATIARAFNATDGGSFQRTTMDVWKDSEISSGAKTVALSSSGGSGTGGGCSLGIISLSGVDQTTPYGGAATNGSTSGANFSATATGVGATDLVVDGWGHWQATASVGANQTSRVNNTSTNVRVCMSTQSGADGGAMTWTCSGGAEWAGGAAAFKEASGGAVSATITGVTATATAAANAGTVAAKISTTIAGATATATAAAGTGAVLIARAVPGVTATAVAAANAATIAAVQIASVSGGTATATAAANAATVAAQVQATITGVTATAAAVSNGGTVAAVQIVSVSGGTATAQAAALEGTVNTGVPATISGATAAATAAAGAGTVAAQVQTAVSGSTATSTASAGSGAVQIGRTVAGEKAAATAAALAAVIAAALGATVAGERATATAAALVAVLATVQTTAIAGATAAGSAAALAGAFVSNTETDGVGFAPPAATARVRRLPAPRARMIP